MSLFPLHKGLLWKEWRQNRWMFWVGLVVMSLSPIFTLFDLLLRLIFPQNGFSWSYYVHAQGVEFDALATGYASVFLFEKGIFAVLLLGVILLAQERRSPTLDFLAATPVSRREILTAKYVTGLRMIGTVLLVNLLYVVLMGEIFSNDFPLGSVLLYFLEQGSVLVALYSLSFFVSAICGNLFSSLIGAVVLVYLPAVIVAFAVSVLRPVWPSLQGLGLYDDIAPFGLPFYITDVQLRHEHVGWTMLAMILLTVVFYLLAVFLFERNPFEKNGRFLMFGRVMPILQVAVPLVLAIVVAVQDDSPVRGLVHFVIVFAVCFGLFWLAKQVRRRLGFR